MQQTAFTLTFPMFTLTVAEPLPLPPPGVTGPGLALGLVLGAAAGALPPQTALM